MIEKVSLAPDKLQTTENRLVHHSAARWERVKLIWPLAFSPVTKIECFKKVNNTSCIVLERGDGKRKSITAAQWYFIETGEGAALAGL